MFLDASAIVAILAKEDGYDALVDRMERAERLITSGLALMEAVLAIHRIDRLPIPAADKIVRDFLARAEIALVPITDAETQKAVAAYATFGKGQGHPARLNIGDCFAYACAKVNGVSLLFVGNDFPQTDIPSALA